MITPPNRILIGHKRMTGLDDRLRAARPDLDIRAKDLDLIDDADLAWAETFVGFRRPKTANWGSVRWIHSVGAGVDAYIFPPIPAGILLTRSSEDFGPDIAEWCVGHALTITQARRAMDRAKRERVWTPDHPERLAGQRVVVVGTGQVGGAIGRAFAALGCPVTGVSRSGAPVSGFERVVTIGELDAVLPDAKWVILATPLTPDTRGLLSGARMARCRGAVLLNVGRGALADESAIPAALDAGQLRAAALDVFEREPLPPASPLWARDDVYITPHIAGLTTIEGAALGFLECLGDLERGATPKWVVDPALGY
ncbi:MAG: D-2-hydroxyacid dehydrogenase [Gemmatimonadetes bacterium]|nr:D-2-hydroxyacid dehydrogenase [Gemmatimonadota bacterium]